jgi:hypothetical protein
MLLLTSRALCTTHLEAVDITAGFELVPRQLRVLQRHLV